MHSVRLQLLAIALLPLIVLLPLLLGVTMLRWINKYDDLLIAKVGSDLRVAEQYFGRISATLAAEVAAVAQSVDFFEAKSHGEFALEQFVDQPGSLAWIGAGNEVGHVCGCGKFASQIEVDTPDELLVGG